MISKEQFGFNAFWWEKLHTEDDIKACVDCLARIGYQYVEFKRVSFRQERLAMRFKSAVKVATAAGLKVSNFVVLRDLVNGDQKAIDDVVETIEACSEAGVGILNFTCGGLPEPIKAPPEDWWMPPQACHQPGWEKLLRALETISAAAERHGVYLAMEPLVGTLVQDYYSLQELFRRFAHPSLAVTMDPSHLFLCRNDIPYAVRQLGEKIKHVHMKDAVGHPGVIGLDFSFTSLGAGGIDWRAFFRALGEIGYRGALSAEYEQFKYLAQVRNNDPEYAAKTAHEEMTALYNLSHVSKSMPISSQ